MFSAGTFWKHARENYMQTTHGEAHRCGMSWVDSGIPAIWDNPIGHKPSLPETSAFTPWRSICGPSGLCESMSECTWTQGTGQAGRERGQVPGSQQGGAGAHGADQVDGKVTAAVVGQGEPCLSMLQPRDVAGLPQAGGHGLPHLQPLPDVPARST